MLPFLTIFTTIALVHVVPLTWTIAITFNSVVIFDHDPVNVLFFNLVHTHTAETKNFMKHYLLLLYAIHSNILHLFFFKWVIIQ